MFIAAAYRVMGNWYAVLILQALLCSFGPILLYLSVRRFHEKAALVAAYLLALDPTRLYWSTTLMTDGLTLLTTLGAIYLFTRWMQDKRQVWLAGSGGLIGLSILIRPINILLWIPLTIIVLIVLGWKKWRVWLPQAALFVMCVGLVVAPWSIRNRIQLGTWQLSVIGTYSFAYANALLFSNYADGSSLEDLYASFYRRIKIDQDPVRAVSFEFEQEYKDFAAEKIDGRWFKYGIWHTYKTIPLFLNDGLRQPAEALSLIPSGAQPNLTDLFLSRGAFSKLQAFAGSMPQQATLLFIGTSFWLLVYLAALYGLWMAWVKGTLESRSMALLCVFMVAYYVAVSSGPVGQPRYRLPIEPWLFLLAAYGVARRLKTS
jgi:4-amino-4-deoxy-L-arabinose transferase-like glycosyltransferase